MDSTQQDAFAHMLANTLNEPGAWPLYRKYVQRYPASFLKEKLDKVMATPPEQITTNRAAFFIFLIKQYDPRYHSRD
ncbi:MAG: hypothetical protein IBJ09_11735 [Bacteroidia bacterium]|nr:hypothetical protein [Bacteroidia bacterium]